MKIFSFMMFGIMIISASVYSQTEKIVTIVNNNIVTICDSLTHKNCCSHYFMNVQKKNNNIKIIETDTARDLCNCDCIFDLSVTFGPLAKGEYNVNIYETEKFDGFKDTTYVGNTSFSINSKGNEDTISVISQAQSNCLSSVSDISSSIYKWFTINSNPLSSNTIITFDLDKPEMVYLKLYDYSGKEISSIIQGLTSEGHHEISYNAESLKAGIYLCRLSTQSYTGMKKIIKIQ